MQHERSSHSPNASGPNASGPNASGPNASGPNASSPNASSPNAFSPGAKPSAPAGSQQGSRDATNNLRAEGTTPSNANPAQPGFTAAGNAAAQHAVSGASQLDARQGDQRHGDLKSGDLKSGDLKSGEVKNGDQRNGDLRPGLVNQLGGAMSKATSLQSYHLLAFRKALHPEFFGIEGRQRVQHGDYETEAWIFRGGHSLRFQLNGFCMSEIVVEHIDQIPDRGLIAALPCAGERDFEEKIADNLVYMTTMQTETLSDHLYLGTYKEMMQHARENDSLFAAWTDSAGKPNLSLVDVQHFRTEVHVQGYHLRSDCGLVLRTQSMIQIVTPKSTKGGKGDVKRGSRDGGLRDGVQRKR